MMSTMKINPEQPPVKSTASQPQSKCWHTLFGISIFFLLMWVAGVVLLSFGVMFEKEANGFKPNVDFKPMHDKCIVKNVTHVAEQREDSHPYCVDVYLYSFRSAAGLIYTSGADEKQHSKGTWCESSQQIPASFEVDQETACWQPKAINSIFALRTFYNCGNTDCVKILDPADEYATKKGRARLFLVLGVAFLVVGFTMWCFLGHTIVHLKIKEEVVKQVHIKEMVDTEPVRAYSARDADVYQKA